MKGRSVSGQAAHETLRFERIYNARPERVFAAFADVPTRARWGTPSPDAAIVYSSANFAVGGVDVSRCGARDDLRYSVTARYEDIVQNSRIVFVETVSTEGKLLSVSLITWELSPVDKGTRVVVTDQLTALDGADMASGTRFGMNAALDNLTREFMT